jgi:pimeloyl-ACP methyl ester carboxylesterase
MTLRSMKYLGIFAGIILGVALSMVSCTSFRTKPILDEQGRSVPGSVASLERIKLGGVDQWILIRGQNAGNPILLKLHGGPGQAEMATVKFNRLLEKDFLVVEWDQRGAGKSASGLEPRSGMNLDQFVEDTHELTKLLLDRFHQTSLILVGHSWGSVIGLRTVQKYPDLFRAFVSTGQIANFSEGLEVGYNFVLAEAKSRKDTAALKDLTKVGAPPWNGDDREGRRKVIGKWLGAYGGIWHSSEKFDRVRWMLSSVEYAWPEKLRYSSAAEKSFGLLLPDLLAVDMATAVPKVDVPVYFLVGKYDHMAPFEVSQKYYSTLAAPQKTWVEFENSAHFPQWEEMEKFDEVLVKKVLPETRR